MSRAVSHIPAVTTAKFHCCFGQLYLNSLSLPCLFIIGTGGSCLCCVGRVEERSADVTVYCTCLVYSYPDLTLGYVLIIIIIIIIIIITGRDSSVGIATSYGWTVR